MVAARIAPLYCSFQKQGPRARWKHLACFNVSEKVDADMPRVDSQSRRTRSLKVPSVCGFCDFGCHA